jgi:hypothetical protein
MTNSKTTGNGTLINRESLAGTKRIFLQKGKRWLSCWENDWGTTYTLGDLSWNEIPDGSGVKAMSLTRRGWRDEVRELLRG